MRRPGLGLIGLAATATMAAGWGIRKAREYIGHRDIRELYEQLIRSDAVCRMDARGFIADANGEMRRLSGRKTLTGVELLELVDDADRLFVRDALAAGPSGDRGRHTRDISLRRPDGFAPPVRVEIGPLTSRRRWVGSYAKFRDISRDVERQTRWREALRWIFDASSLGIATIDARGELTYANKSALDLTGAKTWKGTRIRDFCPDDETYRLLNEQLSRRLEGNTAEYDVELARLDDGTRTPVRVTGIPETDIEGRPIGAVAIIRSVARERAIAEMHRHVETTRDPAALVRGVADITRRLVPWDDYGVALYSHDMRHAQVVYAADDKPPQRWWSMTEELIAFVNAGVVRRVTDLQAFLDRDGMRHLRDEPGTKWVIERGMQSFMFVPIKRQGRVVASISFMSRAKDAFQEPHEAAVTALPLDQAILMAMHILEEEELRSHLELIRDIAAASGDIHQVAQELVQNLARQHRWSSVSLFVVDEPRRKLRLLYQAASSPEHRLALDYTQDLDTGVLGLVRRTGQSINTGDAPNDPRTRDVFVACIPNTRSELCVPISLAGTVRWILNVEDSQVNAFADDELLQVQGIAGEVGAVLYRASLHHRLDAILASASDAIVVTDTTGGVALLNPAATRLFGHSEAEPVVGRPLRELIPETVALLGTDGVPLQTSTTTNATFTRADGETVDLLLSVSPLPVEFGGQVFIMRDLSLQRRVEMLEETRRTYYEVAVQAKTPLSLAFAWLRGLERRTPKDVADVIDRVVRQLLKVELTYDRLVLYERKSELKHADARVLLTLDEVVDGVVRQLPQSEMERVDWRRSAPSPPLRGDVFRARVLPGEHTRLPVHGAARGRPVADRRVATEREGGAGGADGLAVRPIKQWARR